MENIMLNQEEKSFLVSGLKDLIEYYETQEETARDMNMEDAREQYQILVIRNKVLLNKLEDQKEVTLMDQEIPWQELLDAAIMSMFLRNLYEREVKIIVNSFIQSVLLSIERGFIEGGTENE